MSGSTHRLPMAVVPLPNPLQTILNGPTERDSGGLLIGAKHRDALNQRADVMLRMTLNPRPAHRHLVHPKMRMAAAEGYRVDAVADLQKMME
jgi:hypothetical protein